jgi:hypothetical protein
MVVDFATNTIDGLTQGPFAGFIGQVHRWPLCRIGCEHPMSLFLVKRMPGVDTAQESRYTHGMGGVPLQNAQNLHTLVFQPTQLE